MKKITYITAPLAFVLQLIMNLRPIIQLMESNALLAALRFPLLLLLWAVFFASVILGFLTFMKSGNSPRMKMMEEPMSRFQNALTAFSSGDLTAEVNMDFNCVEDGLQLDNAWERVHRILCRSIEEFHAVTSTPIKRLCFTGDNSYHEGLVMGEQIEKYMKQGDHLLIVIPFFKQVLHALRAKGCASYFQQHNRGIRITAIVEGKGNGPETVKKLKEIWEKNSDIQGIYLTDGVTPAASAEWLKEAGLGNKVSLFAHDITEENIGIIKTGQLKSVLAEDFFAQTYNALMYLYNSLEDHWKPVSHKIYMSPIVVDQSNAALYWDDEKKEQRITEEQRDALVKPVEHKSRTAWDLGIVLPTAISFFVMGTKGANAAKKELEAMGCKVEIRDGFDGWENFGSCEAMEPHVRSLMNRKVHGYATAVFDRNLTPVVNEAVESGIQVTTYNSEPLNMREIILNVSENIQTLQGNSADLASSAEESSRANSQIVKVMNHIEESSSEQNKKVNATEEDLNQMNLVIKDVSGIVDSYSQAVERINVEAEKGVTQVQESSQSFQIMQRSMQDIDQQLQHLQEDMGRIRQIITTIDTFSTDTNVLAINASIQAARAGEQGKSFAVVATEIRKLSEKSSLATDQISHIIDDVLNGVKGVVEFSASNVEMVSSNSRRLDQVSAAFKVIRDHLEESSKSVKGIHEAVGKVSSSSGSIKEAMEQISKGNQGNMQSIQEISESLRELAEQSQELSKMAAEYKEMANSQERVISQLNY